MKITNEKPEGRSVPKSRYHETFSKLTRENNCISGLEDVRMCNKIAQALEAWAERNIGEGCRVTTTKSQKVDKKPRIWLWWPMQPNTKADKPIDDGKPKTKWVK